MSSGFWYSKDLLNWEFHGNQNLLIYDYAPDVKQVGDYLYFCASRRGGNCPIGRYAWRAALIRTSAEKNGGKTWM